MRSRSFSSYPFIVGIKEKILTPEESNFYKDNPVVGFILFNRNIYSDEQLKKLTSSLKNLYPEREVPIFIDQEGGRVARLKPAVVDNLYPPAEHFGKLYEQDPLEGIRAVKENYKSLMEELMSLGIDSPCAPVADLRILGAHDVIGDRSFGENLNQVIELANASIEGIEEAGGIPFIKHIPGHGRALCDSHIELPKVINSLEELNQSDFKVFKELSKNPKVKWVMTAHIVFDCIDASKPITCSTKGINFLREEIGWSGFIVSDAIEMLALHDEVGAKYDALKCLLCEGSPLNKKEKALEILKKYNIIDETFDLLSLNDQVNFLQNKEVVINNNFINSLVNVSKEALQSGCNIILHCTGELSEVLSIIRDSNQLTNFKL